MSPLYYSIFESRFGYIGIVGRNQQVFGVRIGYRSATKLKKEVFDTFGDQAGVKVQLDPADWFPALENEIQKFLLGKEVDFNDYQLAWPERTSFQTKVHEVVREIPYGETLSYAEVASLSGSPRAARAVGNVMANNPFPLVVPCHRVLGANKCLGGYSTPQGTPLKEKLLTMENVRWKE